MAKPGPKVRTAANSAGGLIAMQFPLESPAYLSERAQAEYARLVGVLERRGLLNATDPRLVELYAMNYDIARLAYEKITTEGATVESDRGNTSEHPSVQTLNAATIRLKAIAVELGLTPASVKAAGGQKSNDPYAVWRAHLKGG
jgi:P27 family predicted phage terminase small subunit